MLHRALGRLVSIFYFFFVFVSISKLIKYSYNLIYVGHNTPSQSLHGSDDEEDSVDEELELKELGLNDKTH